MSWRSLALAFIGGPILAVLIIGAQAGFDPATWPPELRIFALPLAATLGLGLACLSEGDFNARV